MSAHRPTRIVTFITCDATPTAEAVDAAFNSWMALNHARILVDKVQMRPLIDPRDGSIKLHYVVMYTERDPDQQGDAS